jgi:hypothetical protein
MCRKNKILKCFAILVSGNPITVPQENMVVNLLIVLWLRAMQFFASIQDCVEYPYSLLWHLC